MASQGKIVFDQFVAKLGLKATSRYIDGHSAQKLGKFFWPLLNSDFKEMTRTEHGRQAFWVFAQHLKDCFVKGDFNYISELWYLFDQNAKNLFENFYENALNEMIGQVL